MENLLTNSELEAIKLKDSERLFYKYLSKSLKGRSFKKICPKSGIYFDLLYIEDKKASLFKFMDTNEDTFEIIGQEIIEIIAEEKEIVEGFLIEEFGYSINYFFVMPYIDKKHFSVDQDHIIDKTYFENLINEDLPLNSLLSDIKDENQMIYGLANEYFVYNREVNHGDVYLDLEYKSSKIKGILMEEDQITRVNDISYGITYIEGPTATGKSAILLSRAIKLARLFPNDQFIYITFDKQSTSEIKAKLSTYYSDIKNLRVINFHQFILRLGSKHGLRLNKNSKQKFNIEFRKVFNKVVGIYKDKHYYKGIFVDESENFSDDEMNFLNEIRQNTRSFLNLSYDYPKKMSQVEGEQVFLKRNSKHIRTDSNYRQARNVAYLNRNFQNDINSFSVLELDELKNYFLPFDIIRKEEGVANIVEYYQPEKAMESLVEIIKTSIAKGYQESDISIIYPYNIKLLKGNTRVDSKKLVTESLTNAGYKFRFAEDGLNRLSEFPAITVSNIYNFTNLENKILIFCQLDTLYEISEKNRKQETEKTLNIIYTASARASQELHLLIKKDDNRPGIIDLLCQNIQ